MSIPLYLIGSVLMTGLWLNRSGKQSRSIDKMRLTVPESEKPNDKNIYHSEKYYKTWLKEFDESSRSHLEAQDPINENRIPRFYNEMQTRQEMSPELQSYIEKRGSRFRYYKEKVKGQTNFINEGGNEQGIEDSPMFNPLGNSSEAETAMTTPDEQRNQVEGFQVTNRRSNSDNGGTTKQEHFGMFTTHGPKNSNNPNFHNNMVPFFGSHAYQNTDPMAHQHLMERFTGQTNDSTELRSQPKREIPSLYDRTPGQTFIYGTPSDNSYQRDRYQTSTLKTNVTPIEQVRVGPGISGTYDSAPRDGFHPWYRCPERNVDELRVNPKNVYGGRLLPGKEINQNRGIQGLTFKHRPDRFYINDPRRWNKTTGSYTAPQIRENFVANKQNREDTNVSYTGIGGNPGSVQAQRPTVYVEGSCATTSLNSQVKHSDRNQLPSTGPYRNLQGDAIKTQNYLYDQAKPTTKETTHIVNYMGQAGADLKNQKYLYDEAKPTTKQTTHALNYMGQVGSEAQVKNQKYMYDQAKPTTKETTHALNYMGQVGSEAQVKNQKYMYDEAKPTIKETTYVMGYQGQVGHDLKNQKYMYDDAKPTIKETTHVMGYQGQVGSDTQIKAQQYMYDDAKPTIRQTTNIINYIGQAGNEEQLKAQQYLYDDAKPTIRETTNVLGYMGQAGSEGTTKQQKYLYDQARATTKQTTHIVNYMGSAGNGENTVPQSYEAIYNATTNNNQESLLENRAYGPNKNTNISVGACDINMQITPRAGYDITKYGPNENRQYTAIPSIGQNFQNTTSQAQRDQPGVRQPEQFVVSQFQSNPYTQSLYSAPRTTSPWVRAEIPFVNQ